MKIVILTVAGLSSRFNEGLEPSAHQLKAIYYTASSKDTLLYHMIEKCDFADRIIVVGGYQYKELADYIAGVFPVEVKSKVVLVENKHFADLSSGYSLYLGIKKAFDEFPDVSEVLFAEGDLDVDEESFRRVALSDKSVITYNRETIFSNKAVVVYQNEGDKYCYVFNRSHGMLKIDEPFKAIWNSGQIWKFSDTELLKKANDSFAIECITETNLKIIQEYFNGLDSEDIVILGLARWVNCNTRADYTKIMGKWEDER